jgi:hypothetical protein
MKMMTAAKIAKKMALSERMNDKRRHRRIELVVPARFMTSDKSEYVASVSNMSPGGVALNSDFSPAMDERVVIYIDDLGRHEGVVVRSDDGNFAIQFDLAPTKADRTAEKLTWLMNSDDLDLPAKEGYRRVDDVNRTRLILSDNSTLDCRVTDLSFTSVTLITKARPMLGEIVTVGVMRGAVADHLKDGIRVDFENVQARWGSLSGA